MTPLKQQISLIPFSLEKGDNTIAAIDIGQIRYRRKGVKKNGTDLLYHHAKYGGDRTWHAGTRRKSVKICLFVTLSNYEVSANEHAIKQCNIEAIMVPLHRGSF